MKRGLTRVEWEIRTDGRDGDGRELTLGVNPDNPTGLDSRPSGTVSETRSPTEESETTQGPRVGRTQSVIVRNGSPRDYLNVTIGRSLKLQFL